MGGGASAARKLAAVISSAAKAQREYDNMSEDGPDEARRPRSSLRAVDDLLRVLDRGLVRRFVFLQDVDRCLRRGGGFFLVAKLRLNLRLLVVHEVGVWVLLQSMVDPLLRLVHVLVVIVVKGRGLQGGARVERSPCASYCIELLAYLLDIVRGQLHRHARLIPKEIKGCGSAFHITQGDRERLDGVRIRFGFCSDTRGIVL